MTDAEVLALYGWKLICEIPLTIEDPEGGRATLSIARRLIANYRKKAKEEGRLKEPKNKGPLPMCFVCGKPIKGVPKFFMKMTTLPQHRECNADNPRG